MSDTSVTFDPFAPGFAADPYPQYATLRDGDPVHETAFGPWLLTRYRDVVHLLRDPSLSVEDRHVAPGPFTEMARQAVDDEWADRESLAMLNRDPPDHTRLRRLVTKAFTPRTIAELRDRVEEWVHAALDRAADAGSLELVGDLAFPLPFDVISEMLGMPDTDRDRLRDLSGTLVRTLEPVLDPDLMRAIAAAGREMGEMIGEAVAWKRQNPADDLLSALIAAEEHGDVLSDEELNEQVLLLYVAGHETTVNLIGNGVLALIEHPDEMRRLHHDPQLAGAAVEELLRYDSPVQWSRRITKEPIEVDGTAIPQGSFVMLALASANRDPAKWGPDVDAVRIGRESANQHVAFGGGAHYCLGAALARLEGEVAIGSLVSRFAEIEPVAEPQWNGRLNLRGLERLPLTVA